MALQEGDNSAQPGRVEAQEVAMVPSLSTFQEEAFMTLLLAMTDTRKRVLILTLLSFAAMC